MAELILPIIGLVGAAGYYFSKDGKNTRDIKQTRQFISETSIGQGPNIYEGDMYNKAHAMELQKSFENYKQSSKPSETGILPPLYNTYSVVGKKEITIPSINTELSDASIKNLSDVYHTNRIIDPKLIPENKQPKLDDRPMFNPDPDNVELKGQKREQDNSDYFNRLKSDKSLLTGTELSKVQGNNLEFSLLANQPIEFTHTNMVPFFGSTVKQNIEGFKNESILDKYTGETDTFRHKREIGKLFKERPDNIYGTPVITDEVAGDKERYIPSLYRQNEKPFQEKRIRATIAGTVDNPIRPKFRTVNELRPGNDPKITYKGRYLNGKVGEGVGEVRRPVDKNRPDTYYEKDTDHYFRGPGANIAHTLETKETYKTVFEDQYTTRSDQNIEWLGPVSDAIKHGYRQGIEKL